MNKALIHRLNILWAMVFIGWLSFVPEPLQSQSKPYLYLVFGIFLVFSLYGNDFHLKKYFFKRADLFFWVYLISISFNIWLSPDKKVSLFFYEELSLMSIFIYFFIKNEFGADLSAMKKMLYALVISAGAIALFGAAEMISHTNPIYEKYVSNFYYWRFIGNRMMSTLIHPNILGCFLAINIPLAYYFYRSSKAKALHLIVMGLIILGLFLTFSRGSWLAFLCGLSVWLWVKRRRKLILWCWVSFLGFSLFADLYLGQYDVGYRIGIKGLWSYLKYGHRTQQYFVAASMFKEHPLVGIGLNLYRPLFTQFSFLNLNYEVMIPDSIYLMHLAETGLVGFLGLLLLILNALRKSWRALAEKTQEKELRLAVTISFIIMLFNFASFDGFLWQTPLYLFWIFLALVSI